MATNRGLLIVLAVLIVVLLAGPLLRGAMMGGGMMGPGMMGWWSAPGAAPGLSRWEWGLAMGAGGLMMLAFWGALIVGVALLVRWLGLATRAGGSGRESALDIAKRRYAAGELTREQYEQLRQDLER